MIKTKIVKDNFNKGIKAKNDVRSIYIGRIRFNSWALNVLKARDVIIYETELVHILNRHSKELQTIGLTPIDFVKFVIQNYNVIYQGSGNSFLLVVLRNKVSNMAAIELTNITEDGKEKYKIKTASPINTGKLLNKEILCANDR